MSARAAVIDSSAAVAILLAESGRDDLLDHLDQHTRLVTTAPTEVEMGIVLEGRKGPTAATTLRSFLREFDVEIVPFDDNLAQRALDGWRRYGKGRHPAALNMGDCFTYALASELSVPIVCTGNDFAQTDLEVLRPTPV